MSRKATTSSLQKAAQARLARNHSRSADPPGSKGLVKTDLANRGWGGGPATGNTNRDVHRTSSPNRRSSPSQRNRAV